VTHPPGKTWYALQLRAKAEFLVARYLIDLEVEHFLPLCKAPFSRNGRPTAIVVPLFPGYLFCHADLLHGPKFYQIPGVIKIVSSGKVPLAISPTEIEQIHVIASSEIPTAPYPFLKCADEVVVTQGPLRGVKGVYIGTHRSGQLIVSFPLLQRSINIRVDPAWIKTDCRSSPLDLIA
jgi:transcription antitermination factor NusG